MNKIAVSAMTFVLLCAVLAPQATSQTTPDGATTAVVAAAAAFLNSLSPSQREKVRFPFTTPKTATAATFARSGGGRGPGGGDNAGRGPGGGDNAGRGPGGGDNAGRGPGGGDNAGRGPGGGSGGRKGPGGGPGMGPGGGFVGEQYGQAVWSNYPVSDVPRPGLTIGSLNTAQRGAEMHLLQVLLSPKGYQKVLEIMGSDQALAGGGTQFTAGVDAYTIGVFGDPSVTTPWMLEFGGHHLALNITIAGDRGVLTPTLTGAQPAIYTSSGKTVRALAQENDKAFALLTALSEAERQQAILNYRIGDLVLGPGHSGETIQPEGVRASAMNEQQKGMLLDLISEWTGIINSAYVPSRMAEIKAGLSDTWFAWSGPTTHEAGKNGSSYYRIQGPKLIIEFSPQGVGGDPTMHIHTIYRDPTNEYGAAFTTR